MWDTFVLSTDLSERNHTKINILEEIKIMRAAKSADILNYVFSRKSESLYGLIPPVDQIKQIIVAKVESEERYLNSLKMGKDNQIIKRHQEQQSTNGKTPKRNEVKVVIRFVSSIQAPVCINANIWVWNITEYIFKWNLVKI